MSLFIFVIDLLEFLESHSLFSLAFKIDPDFDEVKQSIFSLLQPVEHINEPLTLGFVQDPQWPVPIMLCLALMSKCSLTRHPDHQRALQHHNIIVGIACDHLIAAPIPIIIRNFSFRIQLLLLLDFLTLILFQKETCFEQLVMALGTFDATLVEADMVVRVPPERPQFEH